MLPHELEFQAAMKANEPEVKSHFMNVERVTLRLATQGATPAEVARKAEEMFDSVVAKSYERHNLAVACHAGCAHCCCVPVQLHAPELDLIVQRLRDKLTADEIEILKQRMQGILVARKAGQRPRCALLGADERCTVYDVRPIKCRACNSPDVAPCKNYEETGDETPRPVFTLPMMFSDLTQVAMLKAHHPTMSQRSMPYPQELMEGLLKRL
jgi:Fe-S-cluster containining protein